MTTKKIPIDWDYVDAMLFDHLSGIEIAANLGCYPDTLYNRCEQEHGMNWTLYATPRKAKGDGAIKRMQMKKAMKGDNTMLIWLGKQRLGQRENASETIIPEDVLKAFESLMNQIESAKKERETKVEACRHTDSPQSHAPVSSPLQPATIQGMARLSVFQ